MSGPKLILRWIFSPLESVPSPMVEHARSQAETPEAGEAAAAIANGLHPPYELPVCRQYAQQYEAPWHHDGFALVLCKMDPTHLLAAQKDSRLHVFASIHEDPAVPDHIADHHAVHGVKRGQTLREALKELSRLHVG